MGYSDDDLLTTFSGLASLCSAIVIGSVEVALLQATLIWSKHLTPRKANIVTAIVVTVAAILTVTISIPFGATPNVYDAMQSNYDGPTAVTEKYPTGYLNISEKQKMIFDITMLIGISSVCLPLIIKLPSSGMINMYLAQIGVYVAIPDVTGFIQWEITHVVISSLVFPIISGLLSVAVFFGIKKLILSKLHPDNFLHGYLPSIIAFLAAENTFALLHQHFLFVEYIPEWLKIIISALMAFFAWLYKKYIYPFCAIRLQVVNVAEQVELPIMQEDVQSMRISESNLSRIASCFGPKWELFMDLLGIPKEDIDEMKYNFPDDRHEQVYRCLRRLQERNPEKATLKCVVENSSATYLNMKKFKAVLKGIETKEGNNKEDSITMEDEEDEWSDDEIELLNISLPLKFQSVCSLFIHGSAVIGHILGPVTSLVLITTRYNANDLPLWEGILLRLYLCVGVVIGVAIFGHRIIGNIGDGGQRELSPLRCFCIEIGFALTTLLASLFGLPLSSTIWKIVSIFSAGYVQSRRKPNIRCCLKILVMVLGCIALAFLLNVTVTYSVRYYNL